MEIITNHLEEIFFPPLLTLIFLVKAYLWARTVRRGMPLTARQVFMIKYATMGVLGMAYCMAWHDALASVFHWQRAWIAVIVSWASLLALIAIRRHGTKQDRSNASQN